MLKINCDKIVSFNEGLALSDAAKIFLLFEDDYSKEWREETFADQELEVISKGLEAHSFKATIGNINSIVSPSGKNILVFIGLGKQEGSMADQVENLRKGVSNSIKWIKKHKIESSTIFIPKTLNLHGRSWQNVCYEAFVTAGMTGYEYNAYRSKKTDQKLDLSICIDSKEGIQEKEVLQQASVAIDGLNLSRSLSDTPPNICTPKYFVEKVTSECKDIPDLKVRVIGEKEAEELGLSAFLAVGSGSVNESQFLVLSYEPKSKSVKKIALVGKGVTFDTGGINLKPGDSMSGMKYDMSGAATCVAATIAAARLGLDVSVVCTTPLVENMPSGTAYRQEDVIVPYAKSPTIEIGNTDAEGRVILADALAWTAKEFAPDLMIDVATLTGACIVALGPVYAAILSNNDSLAQELIEVGARTGDWLWRLPLHKLYKKAIESNVADINNSGKKGFGAGTITAAEFLQSFVPDGTPWAHLDIAGVDTCCPNRDYGANCSSGFGVRLLIEFLKNQPN